MTALFPKLRVWLARATATARVQKQMIREVSVDFLFRPGYFD